jgi:hypothetical protein
MDDSAGDLRARAAELRRLASAIGAASAGGLHRRAGDDTWRGPTATVCLDVMLAVNRSLHHAAEELRTRARHLDRLAEQRESLPAR